MLPRQHYVVIASMVVQAILSIVLVAVTIQTYEVKNSANDYEKLLYKYRLEFDKITSTTERLFDAIDSTQSANLIIVRIQQSLARQTDEAQNTFFRIEEAASVKSGSVLVDVQQSERAFRIIKPLLQSLIHDLKIISQIESEKLLYATSYSDRINLAVAPGGEISRGIENVALNASLEADSISTLLKKVQAATFAAFILITLFIGFFLVVPAARNLSLALSREKGLSVRLEMMVKLDQMTGLLNRTGLDEVVTELGSATYACAIIDLNKLKPVNDTFGHAAGDAVLLDVAKRLRATISPSASAARVGGDEFVVVDPTATSHEDCIKLGETLKFSFARPILYEDCTLDVGAAIGISISTQANSSYKSVAALADAAMYEVKKRGVTGYKIYSNDIAHKTINLERKAKLVSALRRGEFVPWYQPKCNMATGELLSFEALCRWQHRPDSVLFPDAFLKELEQYDLLGTLTDRMLSSVLEQIRSWTRNGFDVIPVSVNISAVTLTSRSEMNAIENRLKKYSEVLHLIMFEITEDVFLDNILDRVKLSIKRLISLGVRISIDDFGSGYASFRHLTGIAFHELKIDRSFVEGIGRDKSAEVVLGSFITITNSLNVAVVAEGVETEAQRQFLNRLGYDVAQGYLFGKPEAAADVANRLHRTTPCLQGARS